MSELSKLQKGLLATALSGAVAASPAMADEEPDHTTFNGHLAFETERDLMFVPSDSDLQTENIDSRILSGSAHLGFQQYGSHILVGFAVGDQSDMYENPFNREAQSGQFKGEEVSYSSYTIQGIQSVNDNLVLEVGYVKADQYASSHSMAGWHRKAMQETIDEEVVSDATAYWVGVKAGVVNLEAAKVEGETFSGLSDERTRGTIYLTESEQNSFRAKAGISASYGEIGQNLSLFEATAFVFYESDPRDYLTYKAGFQYTHSEQDYDSVHHATELGRISTGYNILGEVKGNLTNKITPVRIVGFASYNRSEETIEIDGRELENIEPTDRRRLVTGVGLEIEHNIRKPFGDESNISITGEFGFMASQMNSRNSTPYVEGGEAQKHEANGGYGSLSIRYDF